MPDTTLTIKNSLDLPTVQTDAQTIRKNVFVLEQGIPASLEFDQMDAQAVHWVGYFNQLPVTTCRLTYYPQKNIVKMQRVATLHDYRGFHFGSILLNTVLTDLKDNPNIHIVTLDAQQNAQIFYQKLGFSTVGTPFEEAGITHVQMIKKVK